MKSSRVILGCLVIALLATAASAAWVPLTDRVTLSSLQGGSLVFGDKELSEIELFGFGDEGALDPNPDKMFVQGGQDDVTGDYGLKFNLSWNAFSGQTVNANLNFKISVLPDYDDYFIKDVVLDITGSSATGTGGVNLGERVQNAEGDIIASLSCSKQYNDGGAYLTDYADFDPLKAIWIRSKDISITGGTGTGGAGHLSEFYQYYSQIPEPATLCLLSIGGLILLRRRRKKHICEEKQR